MARPPPQDPDSDAGIDDVSPEHAVKTMAQPSPFADAENEGTQKAPRAAPPRRSTRAAPVAPAPPRKSAPPRRTTNGAMLTEDPPPEADGNATMIGPPPRRQTKDEEAPADENATQAGPPIVLEIAHGPDEGQKFKVRGGRMVIGRGEGCDLRLSDGSASRRHAELVVGPRGAVLRDLGSGNGTQVNGEKVAEVPVQHGDQIYIGQTVLQVVDELKRFEEMQAKKRPAPAPAPARRAPPPRRTGAVSQADEPAEAELGDDEGEDGGTVRVPARASGISKSPPRRAPAAAASVSPLERFRALPPKIRFGILGGVGLVVLFSLLSLVKGKPVETNLQPSEARYTELFEAGKKLQREGKFEAALEPLQAAKELKSTKEVDRWIETCQRDGKSKKMLEQAKRLAGAGNFEQALETLKKVDELSNFSEEAKTLSEKYEEGRIKSVTDQVRKAAQSGDVQGARDLLAKLPPEKASELEPELGEMSKQFERDRANQAVAAASAAERDRQRRGAAARAKLDSALSAVYRKVDQGNFDGAVREIERVLENGSSAELATRCRLLKTKIPIFGSNYTDGVGKYNGGQYEAAASSLLRALNLLREMDIPSTLESGLKDKAARAVGIKGRSALARQEYGTAAKAFRDSLQLSPGNAEATNGLAEISRRATDVYMEGYTAMNTTPDIARKKFETVLEMAPPDSKPYQDAKRRLRELGQ